MAIKHFTPKKKFADKRGYMIPLINEDKFKPVNVLYIVRSAGSISGNHYHKKESYWEYCMKGSFEYFEKDIDNPNAKVESIVVKESELLYCQSGRAHAMKFLEDSVVICLAGRSRKQKAYDSDVVKLKII